MRIGLFGGTFDPPHPAHLGASLLAMKRLKLDRVWWLVTPGNPLKNTRDLAPLAKRIAAARSARHHPRIDVTGLEAVINTRYTYDTIRWLVRAARACVSSGSWAPTICGSFHRWQKMARHCEPDSDGGGRPPGTEPLRRQPARPARRWPATVFRRTTRAALRTARAGLGFICTD